MSYDAVEEVLLALQEGGLIEDFDIEKINCPTCQRNRFMSWVDPGRELELVAGGLYLTLAFAGASEKRLLTAAKEQLGNLIPSNMRHNALT